MEHKDVLKLLVERAGAGYSEYKLIDEKAGYFPKRGADKQPLPIADAALDAHLSSEQPIGINVVSGDRKSHFCIFDLDDHKGTVSEEAMVRCTIAICAVLEKDNVPFFVVRSGGGRGVHIWVVMEKETSSVSLLSRGKEVLERASDDDNRFVKGSKGLFADTNERSGKSTHEVDIFPKGQGDNYIIALPFSRKSHALTLDSENTDCNGDPTFKDAGQVEVEFAEPKKRGPKAAAGNGKEPDYDAAFDAFIQNYDVESYDNWGTAALCLITAFGSDSEWAQRRWVGWTKTGRAYKPGDEEKWHKVGTPRFTPFAFWRIAKDNGYSGALPFSKPERKKLTALAFIDDVRLLRDRTGEPIAQIGPREFVPVRSSGFKEHVLLGLMRTKGELMDCKTQQH